MALFFRERDDGVELFVRLTPRASRDAIEGVEDMSDGRSHLAARVRAVPEKGEANAALEKLLAATLGVPKKSVSVVAGSTSRLKSVRILGDGPEIGRMLAALPRTLR